jgi:hypothetical protein
MKQPQIWIISILLLVSCAKKPKTVEKATIPKNELIAKMVKDTLVTENPFYNQAYNEIVKMLDGTIPMDFKRAVFLTENAYLKGTLSYDQFCRKLDDIELKLKDIIRQKRIETFKTAGNYAIYEYMTKPSSANDFKVCSYDFSDFYVKENWENQFVTKLMKTKKGNCHSLPFLYKILADEMQTEAHLAFAPNHIYIKHLGEDNKWVNVELTNGNLSSDAWMISSLGISAEAIQNGIYMEALTLKESIAYCLTDLGGGYIRQFGEDDFAILCFDKTLEYYPKSIHTLMYKSNVLRTLGLEAQAKNGNNSPTLAMKANYAVFQQTQDLIESLGYREIPKDKYEDWVKSVEAEKVKLSK